MLILLGAESLRLIKMNLIITCEKYHPPAITIGESTRKWREERTYQNFTLPFEVPHYLSTDAICLAKRSSFAFG